MAAKSKDIRKIFVIMPFSSSPTRNKEQLTTFFEKQLKEPIEKGKFKYRYQVRRSDDTFNINEKIITDLYHADIVICDLSGSVSNPNVMYELGMRFAFSNKPVILIREACKDNKTLFDIGGFYAFLYDPLNYSELEDHIKTKLRNLETGIEIYKSPVLTILKQEIPLLQEYTIKRAVQLVDVLMASVKSTTALFVRQLKRYLGELNIEEVIPAKMTDLDELINVLEEEKNVEILKAVDWTKFDWEFGSQPTIDNYLSNLYLKGLIDDDLEVNITVFIMMYQAHFVSTNYCVGKWNYDSIHEYMGETLLLDHMIGSLEDLLGEEDPVAKKDIEAKIYRTLKISHLIGSIYKTSDKEAKKEKDNDNEIEKEEEAPVAEN